MPELKNRGSGISVVIILLSALAMLWVIPRLGPHQDENFFVKPVFFPQWSHTFLTLGGRQYPLLLQAYIGAPKVFLYQAIFVIVQPSLWSLRLPVLGAIIGSIFLIRSGCIRVGHPLTGNALAIFLACSPLIMLTSVFDWGPVCMQMLLLGLAFACWSMGFSKNSIPWLAASAFFAGLGIWEKMTFAFCFGPMLAILFIASLQRLPGKQQIQAVVASALALLLGVSPLILATIIATSQPLKELLAPEILPGYLIKFQMLGRAIVGSSLVGYLTSPNPYWPTISNAITQTFAHGVAVLLHYGFQAPGLVVGIMLGAAAVPGPTQNLRWAFIAGEICSWIAMVIFRNLGSSAHHTVLLIPVLFMLLALTIEDASKLNPAWRVAIGSLAAIVLLLNLASYADYILRFKYLPIPTIWSPAIGSAATQAIKQQPAPLYTDDWGLDNAVILLSAGKVVAFPAAPLSGRDGALVVDRQAAMKILEQRNAVFLGFVAGKQTFPIGPAVLGELASQQHLNRCVIASFPGRPGGETLVELYLFLPSPNCAPSP